ncbi:kinase-like domain-containing protein [Aspergillus californicus]
MSQHLPSSQPVPSTQGVLIGRISRWDPQTGETSDSKMIYSREEIYVGRDRLRCQYVVKDPYISNEHLWIYTVIFDQDNPGEIAPLVYAQDISMNGSSWNGYRMGNGQGSFLLGDGDIIRLAHGIYLKYNAEDHAQGKSFTIMQSLEMRRFANEYIVTRRKLGSGAYGQVHMAYKRSTGHQFACKIVDLLAVKQRLAKEAETQYEQKFKKAISSNEREEYVKSHLRGKLDQYHREAKILEALQHPNIIGLEKVIKSTNTIYMFQDLLTAGDLFSYLQYKGGKLPDIDAAVIVRQIVIALKYLHGKNIVHRDLKPDNILMTSRADGCRIVLTDFGCATLLESGSNRMSSVVGTYEFSAPEVVKKSAQGYTKAADLWSLGCLTAVLLTGEAAFDETPLVWKSITERHAAMGKLTMKLGRYKVGERAQNFVLQLLQYDATLRMDVKKALQHSWFNNYSHRSDFEALYRRSIRDWTPRKTQEPRIVSLDGFLGPPGTHLRLGPSDSGEGGSNPLKFETSSEKTSSQEAPDSTSASGTGHEQSSMDRTSSDTPSEVVLLPIRTKPSGLQNSESTGTWNATLCQRKTKPKDQTNVPFTIYQAAKNPEPATSDSSLNVQALNEPNALAARSTNDWTGLKRPHSNANGVDCDVYEEIRNPVTGKRRHLIYGDCLGKMQ